MRLRTGDERRVPLISERGRHDGLVADPDLAEQARHDVLSFLRRPGSSRIVVNISATYLCGACGNVASTVTLVAPGEPDPSMTPEVDAPPGLDTLFASVLPDSAMLAVDGGPASLSLGAASTAKMVLALESGDPAALYAIDPEYAPFWCPSCGLSYCTEHYRSFPVFDEEFFDYIQGICPRGHERNVMD